MLVIWVWTTVLGWRVAARPPRAEQRPVEGLRFVKYFRSAPNPRVPSWWRSLALVGDAFLVAAVIAGVWDEGLWAGTGLVLWTAASGAALAVKSDHDRTVASLTPKPRDHEMDERLAALLRGVDTEAVSTLHLEGERLITEGVTWSAAHAVTGGKPQLGERDGKPLLVVTPVLSSRSALGWDLGWRFTRWEVVAFCPTRNHLGVFRCRVDVVSGKIAARETDEFYYTDIVSVLTKGASTDGLVFPPVDHSGFGVRELPGLTGRALHFAGPGTNQTVITAVDTASWLHEVVVTRSGRTTEPMQIRLYRSGIAEATQALRGWLRTTWAAA